MGIAGYTGILIMVAVAAAFGGVVVLLSRLIGKRQESREKLMPYECGIDPTGNARRRFSIKFYIIAMLFIIFDIEAVFLYPWAVVYRSLKIFGFIEMVVFVGILLIGFLYVWKKGALEWGSKSI
ncbi:MAG: NADH-quinone oxidoreductase subunit A [Proteobacteria bacterium]|nr:NADH-quinone oxidoreductase subunit A [Pseudomonadota bacterium]